MIVEMGNRTPHQCVIRDGVEVGHEPLAHGEPAVYSWSDHGALTHDASAGLDGKTAGIHVLSNDITHLPDHEGFVSVLSDWPHHSPNPPSWVWSDEPDLARMLSEFYGCPVGIPDDVEDTHHTVNGPPGVGPAPAPEVVEG